MFFLFVLNSPVRDLSTLPEVNRQKVLEYNAREKKRKQEEEEIRYKKLQEEVFGKNPWDLRELPASDKTGNDNR